MLRVIVRRIDSSLCAAGISEHAKSELKTFEISCPELDDWLSGEVRQEYVDCWVVGAEVFDHDDGGRSL